MIAKFMRTKLKSWMDMLSETTAQVVVAAEPIMLSQIAYILCFLAFLHDFSALSLLLVISSIIIQK